MHARVIRAFACVHSAVYGVIQDRLLYCVSETDAGSGFLFEKGSAEGTAAPECSCDRPVTSAKGLLLASR